MERNRETRRACVSSSNGVNTRRFSRTRTLRENPDEDGAFELQESARLRRERVKRDRERKRERQRDFRERQSRCKRRRGGDDTSDESFNEEDDDDEDEDEETTASVAAARYFPVQRRRSFPLGSSSSSSSFRASPVRKPGDEIIASSVPRKPRSASTKRSRDWVSSRSSNTNGGVPEQILRQASSLPARQSGVASPPSSSSSFFKKKLKPNGNNAGPKLKPPTASKQNPSNPEKLEIEIAEVLFGLMNQSLGTSSKMEDSRSNCGPKSSPVSGSGPLQAGAPKRKRPGPVIRPGPVETDPAPKSEVLSPDPQKVFSGEDGLEAVGSSVISRVGEETVTKEDADEERETGAVKNEGNFCSDSPSIATASSTSVVFDTMIKANSTVPEVEIPALDSIPSDVVCCLPADGKSEEIETKKEIDSDTKKEIDLHFDLEMPEISESFFRQHQEIPTKSKIVDEPLPSTSSTSFTQPRPKRCATHCYIARNVHRLQQLVKLNPSWQSAVGPANSPGPKLCDLNIAPSGPVENICSTGPTPPSTSGGKSSSNPSLSGFNYPSMAEVNELQYMSIVQNHASPFPMPSPPGPFFNGSLYPSQMVQPSSTQKNFTGQEQPSRPEIEAKPEKPLQLFQSNAQTRRRLEGGSRGSRPPVRSTYGPGPNTSVPVVHPHQPQQQFAVSSSHQNLAMFQNLPEATRQNIQTNLNAYHSRQVELHQTVIARSKMLAQSPWWKNQSRATHVSSSTLTSHSRGPPHNQISFGGNSKPLQAPPSPSNSSVSKGSSRSTSSTSTNNKAGQSPIFSAQQMKPHMFFSNPYPQAQSPHSNSAGSTTSGPNGFYMQQPTDPAAASNLRLSSQGIMHGSPFLPAGFSYVQLKSAEQK